MRRSAPLALLVASLACASAPAAASTFSGTFAIGSVEPSRATLVRVLADASVTPRCDQAACGWRPVVETVAGGEACVAGSGAPVWTGTAYPSAAPQRFSPSWHELPAAAPVGRRACLFARSDDGDALVAYADYVVPAGQRVAGPDPGLLRTPIPRWVAPVRRHRAFRISTAGVPAAVGAQRFVVLVRAAAVRWGLRVAGVTGLPARRGDGQDTVGFSHDVPRGALGITEARVLVLRRAGRIVARRMVEQDTRFRDDAPWSAGPALPDARHLDLETVILHELGHFAGNGRHAPDCRDTPMWVSLRAGEWWHSPTDWFQRGCGIAPRS